MPNLDNSTLLWIASLCSLAIVWFIVISPHLIPMLSRTLHNEHGYDDCHLSIIDRITLYMASILMFFVALIVCIMFYEVLMRYVFDAPTLWVEELSRWLGGVVFLMSGLYAMQQRSHIRVTIIYDIASRKVQKLFDVISTACILIFAYAVTIGYWKNALTKFSTWELYGSAWNPPIPAIMKPLIVLTLIWMAVQAMNNLIMDWSKTAQIHDSANDTL